MTTTETTSVLNDLIEINNDRVAGFEKAIEDQAIHSYGLNLDRYCGSGSEEQIAEFKNGYAKAEGSFKEWKELAYSDELMEKIFHGNAERILGL